MSRAVGQPAQAVPPPWTPLVVRGDSVRCWGRAHRVRGGVPGEIWSQGEALLAGPVRLRLVGGPPLAWTRSAFACTPRRVAWDARARRAGFRLQTHTAVEYDGFWQVDLQVGAGRLPGLSLEIPLAAPHARYLHFVNETHYQERNTLTLPERAGEVWAGRFACMVWVGDERVGLAWCADTEAPFHLNHPEQALSVHRLGRAATLRITLVDHPVELFAPLRWRFGLIATPVRPLPPRWREWRLGPGASANTGILWWNEWAGSHADPVPEDPQALTARARRARAHGHYLLPYVALLALSERSAAYRAGGWRWRREPLSRLEDEGTPYWIVCPHAPWSRYLPDQIDRLIRETGINGLYVDFTFPTRCQAPGHPCGTQAHGKPRRGEFRVFDTRRLLQSIYERVKARCPDARIMLHTSGALMYPYAGFGDMMLDGEQLRQPLAAACGEYMDVLPLSTLRAEYRGQLAGLVPFVIPELASPSGMPDARLTGTPGPTKELLALTLLHDIGLWPIYCRLASVDAVRRAQQRFGTAVARFLPYWDAGGPVITGSPDWPASAWVRRGGCLVVVVNARRTAVRARLRARTCVLPGRWETARDALTGEALLVKNRAVALEVPARGFRLIEVRFAPAARRRRCSRR